MNARTIFDSAILIYALGGEHPLQQPCRQLLAAARRGRIRAETTALAIQEVLHQRSRRTGDRLGAAGVARDLATVLHVHDLRHGDLRLATELFAEIDGLDAADACHAAIALDRGVATITTPDRAFDGVAGLTRLDPVDVAASLGRA